MGLLLRIVCDRGLAPDTRSISLRFRYADHRRRPQEHVCRASFCQEPYHQLACLAVVLVLSQLIVTIATFSARLPSLPQAGGSYPHSRRRSVRSTAREKPLSLGLGRTWLAKYNTPYHSTITISLHSVLCGRSRVAHHADHALSRTQSRSQQKDYSGTAPFSLAYES